MNIKYLQEEIIPQREKEIAEGKNEGTRQPIYVVMDVMESISFDHVELNYLSYNGKEPQKGYFDAALEDEDREFKEYKDGLKNPRPCTLIYSDMIVAFFLTRKGAEEYLEYQKHNLNKGYIYTFYSGYGNREMDKLLE